MIQLSRVARGRNLGLLLAIAAVLAVLLRLLGARFQGASPYDIVDLQLSFWAERFSLILTSWEATGGGGALRLSLVLDFGFAVAYGLLLYGLYLWLTARLRAPKREAFAVAPLIAAACDWVENVLLLVLISLSAPPQLLVLAMSLAAAAKFAFLLLWALGTLIAFLTSPWGYVLIICRFGILSVLAGSLPLILVGQGQDVLRSLVDPATPVAARAVAIVALLVWATAVWYCGRVLLMLRPVTGLAPADGFVTWVPRVLGTATLVLAGLAFVRAAAQPGGHRGLLLLFAALCGVLAAVFLYSVYNRRDWLQSTVGGVQKVAVTAAFPGWGALPPGTRRVVALSTIGVVVVVTLVTVAPVPVAQNIATLSVLSLFAAGTVFVGSVLVFLAQLWKLPMLTLGLALAAAFSFWNDNHVVRLVPAAAGGKPSAARPELRAAFSRWLESRQDRWDGPRPMPMFLVAAEGGGIRAAFWTAIVLGRLQDESEGRFGSQVFGLSGVSGGSLGAAVFTALLADETTAPCSEEPSADPPRGRLERCAEEALRHDFLSPVLAKMLGPDFFQWLVPAPVLPFDRAWALEDAWAAGYRAANPGSDRLAEPFLRLWQQRDAAVPGLFLNGTHVQTGRRMLLSNVSWKTADIPDTYDLHEVLGADLPLKTAVHNSARFAYISPAGRLLGADGSEHGHVVDGGYFENSGVSTLLDVWKALAGPGGAAPPDTPFVVLYLCNSPARCYLHVDEPPPDTSAAQPASLADLASPLRALLGAREARGALALARLRGEAAAGHLTFIELGVCSGILRKEREAPLPLGWLLSDGMRAEMTRQAAGIGCPQMETSVDKVTALLGAAP